MSSLDSSGYKIINQVFSKSEIIRLRHEAERVSTASKATCVRHLCQKSQDFASLAINQKILRLLPENPILVRSILFDKTETENWPVPWHQDLTIAVQKKIACDDYGPWSLKDGSIHVQPPLKLLQQMVTVRIHLDDTPATNGALRVIAGSHKKGKIPSTDVQSHINKSEITCECKAGDVLLMSPLLLHASNRSQFPKKRRVIHFEYAPVNSLDARLSWQQP